MRIALTLFFLGVISGLSFGQDPARSIFDTEKAFEKTVAEVGIREGFLRFLAPSSVMFMPDAANAREVWSKRPNSDAMLTWNPIWIDVSANGVLAYSIGNSRFRPKGKDDANIFYGHYLSVWLRQPNGEFRAALDTGINHDKPASEPTAWRSPSDIGRRSDPDGVSAADSAVGFYEMVAASGVGAAYKKYLADDAIVMRDGKQPAFSRKAALDLLKTNYRINFAKRKSFTEAVDLAYVHSGYNITDRSGSEVERGNFVQVWTFRGGKWLIVADILVPLPAKAN